MLRALFTGNGNRCVSQGNDLLGVQRQSGSDRMKCTADAYNQRNESMSETVTLELSAELISRAKLLAEATNRRLEEVVADWVGRGAVQPAMEDMSEEELLALCDAMLPPTTQRELSELLARNRESLLDTGERRRLDDLMEFYRQSLALKAKAWRQAVARGLRPPLSDNAA